MGVSEVTADIAVAISNARAPLTAREAYLLFILRGMPLFRDVCRFDLYDNAYRQVAREKDSSATERLIDAVFWLGADCFYGAYSEASTRDYYLDKLVPHMESEGVAVSRSVDLSKW
jgi:hypothetical protein